MMPQMYSFTHKIFLIIAIVLLLQACGGGGGGTLPSTQRPVVNPVTEPIESSATVVDPARGGFAEQPEDPEGFALLVASFETAEYAGMQGLALINASSAYARGADGSGVSLGIIDSGVYAQHLEFADGLGNKVTLVGSD